MAIDDKVEYIDLGLSVSTEDILARIDELDNRLTFHSHDGVGSQLLRGDMRSFNYKRGISGWNIKSDGNAEFNRVEIFDNSIGGTTPITGETAIIKLIKASDSTKFFTIQKRAGTGNNNDNVFEIFSETPFTGRYNAMAIGKTGDNLLPGTSTSSLNVSSIVIASNLNTSNSAADINGSISIDITKNGSYLSPNVAPIFNAYDSRLIGGTDGIVTVIMGRDDGFVAIGNQITGVGALASLKINDDKIDALTKLNLMVSSSDPSAPQNGTIYYNSTSHKIKVFANGSWETVTSA